MVFFTNLNTPDLVGISWSVMYGVERVKITYRLKKGEGDNLKTPTRKDGHSRKGGYADPLMGAKIN